MAKKTGSNQYVAILKRTLAERGIELEAANKRTDALQEELNGIPLDLRTARRERELAEAGAKAARQHSASLGRAVASLEAERDELYVDLRWLTRVTHSAIGVAVLAVGAGVAQFLGVFL